MKDNRNTFSLKNSGVELINRLRSFFKTVKKKEFPAKKLIRLEVPVQKTDIFGWLGMQSAPKQIYWSDRGHSFQVAGIGEAYLIQSGSKYDIDPVFSEMRDVLSETYGNIKFFGGFRFTNHDTCAEEWEAFGQYRFIVPRFEVTEQAGSYILAINFVHSDGIDKKKHLKDLEKEIINIVFSDSYKFLNGNTLESRTDFPDKQQWCENIETALRIFDQKELTKIVFARKSTFKFSRALNQVSLIKNLRKANPEAYHFCFQPDTGLAFIGGTPEQLYYRDGDKIFSEAVAGTRPRGTDKQEDRELERQLLTSVKDLHEHHVVHLSVQMSMRRLCDSIETDQNIKVIKLANLQHLKTHFKGILAGHITDPEILSDLHPTPAVGGDPKEEAVKKITEIEKFDRGFYAAPVGWVGYDQAEFAVGIRTGMIRKNLLTLYSGAGIVKGSVPEEEWLEIENKLRSFIKVLKIDA